MFSIIIFSLTIALVTITHSVGFLIAWVMIVLVIGWYRGGSLWRQDIWIYIGSMICAIASVIYYDYRVLGSLDALHDSYLGLGLVSQVASDEEFVVLSRERVGRYTIENLNNSSQDLLLYSTQSLTPGDIILTKPTPKRRLYTPEVCLWICRQSRQVIDNSPPKLTSLANSPATTGTSFDYERWLYMQDIAGSLYDNSVFITRHQSLGTLSTVRESFFQTLVQRFGKNIHAGLMLGMTIGDRSLIDKERYAQFISSGLVHLIAVSGGNIAIVVIFLGMMLCWVPFYVRQVILICAVIFYALIVGDDSSVIRATIMGLLTLIVLLPGRQLSIWRSLAYARCGMLMYNPYYLIYDMGFSLSFCAIVGILWADKTLRSSSHPDHLVPTSPDIGGNKGRHHIKKTIISLLQSAFTLYIIPTIGAMVGVTPLLLRSMGQTNLFSPLVNIVIVPLVPFITVGSFVAPYLPTWMGGDVVMAWCMDYIGWLSMIGTQYGLYVSLSVWSKYLLLGVMIGYWVYWITTQQQVKKVEQIPKRDHFGRS